MKNLLKSAIVLFLFFISLGMFAQGSLEKNALKHFKKLEYDKALNLYLKLDSASEDKTKYDYMIGMCYLSSETPNKALSYLLTSKSNSTASWIVDYYIGMAYYNSGDYLEASTYLNAYKEGLKELLDAGYGFKKVDISKIESNKRVHFEKTLTDINRILSICSIQK